MRAQFRCKVITPMFMAGADGRTPELRPSEFKGMMRFWWRAIRAESDIKKLKEEEAKIFGGTGEKEGKSKVKIRVFPQPENQFIKNNLKNDYNLNWHFNRNTQSLAGKDAGIGYLLYSTVLPRQERKFIKDGFEFNIELSSFDEKSFKNAAASLWTSIYLGGFGTRARRGGGNIEVLNCDGDLVDVVEFIPSNSISSKENLASWLKNNNIDSIKRMIDQRNGGPIKYPNLRDSKIIILEPKESWQKALNEIGNVFQNFRREYKSDIFNIGAFGMPIMYNRFKMRIVPYENDKRLSERMSSPLIIKVIKTGNNYFPVIVKLSTLLPRAVKEKRRGNNWNKQDVRNINFSKIDEFLNKLPNKKEILL